MTAPFDGFAELRALLDALCEETITDEQFQRLEELLLTHPEAEAYYVQFISMNAALGPHLAAASLLPQKDAECAPSASNQQFEKPRDSGVSVPSRSWLPRRWLIVSAAALAAGVLLAVTLLSPTPRPFLPGQQDLANAPIAEATDNTVAVLLRAPGAEWEKSGLPTRPGAPLPPGWLRLKQGFAQIEFYSGATVIVQGPAELQLISRKQAFCLRGKLRVMVPPQASGFAIGSPKLDLVDRGTEFGLDVAPSGRAEVHVFKGQVDLYPPGAAELAAPQRELTTGKSVRVASAGAYDPINLDSASFRTAQQLTEQSQAAMRQRQRDWLAASETLRRDPSLEVYYTFQPGGQSWSRSLTDQAGGRTKPHDGTIVGCSWVSGRWAGKRGLEFKRVSDRVRFSVPGEFASITLAAWVRVDGLPNRNNSLMMSDGWDSGELHWQIGDSGTLILGVQGDPKGRGAHYHAPGIYTPERFGQWTHLAVVYDSTAGLVTHYIDGKPVAEEPILFDIPLRIGDAELGNWNIASHRNNTPIRFLNGCMDEFMLFSRALTADELDRLHFQGRPPL